MIAAHLLYEAIHQERPPAGTDLCFVCGIEGAGRPLVLPDQFADLWRCDRRGTTMCAACEHAFAPPGYRRFGSALITPSIFRHSRRASGTLTRTEIDAVLFERAWPDEPPLLGRDLRDDRARDGALEQAH